MTSGVSIQLSTMLQSFEMSVDLQLPDKGVTVLFGPSGCGKTTLLRCVAGLHAAQGTLQINREVWQQENYSKPVHQRQLGYIFQEAGLFPHLNVRANLEFGRKRVSKDTAPLEQEAILELLGINHLLDRKPFQLSGGERQRVAIAQALLLQPGILLMDEPLSALDDARKREIMPYLESLRDKLEIPLLYVTHSVDEMTRLADYLVVMEQGKVVTQGGLTETLARLQDRLRLGEESGVVIEGRVERRDTDWHLAQLSFQGGTIWARDMGFEVGTKVRFRVLARDVSLTLKPQSDSSIFNVLPVTLDEISDTEHPGIKMARVLMDKTPLLARVTVRSIEQMGLSNQKELYAQVKTVAIIE